MCVIKFFREKISLTMISLMIFIFFFWLKSGFIDKVIGVVFEGKWAGMKMGMVSVWDKEPITHTLFSPIFNVAFPILMILECLPCIFVIVAVCKGEFLAGKVRPWLLSACVAGLFATAGMSVPEYLANAAAKQSLFAWVEFAIISIILVRFYDKK